MALPTKAHTDFRRSVGSSAKHAPPKRTRSKRATEELALWVVLVVVAVTLISTLLGRAC
ncbi:MAG: hypothetical protein LAO07_18295 [Acidobacteriia bacterium]|nr:hypothetical protein [Terriglobia bacterium]